MKWNVSITTCRRNQNLLSSTLSCIEAAGWQNYTVYAEPGSCDSDGPRVDRLRNFGCWTNWICALFEAFQLDVDADLFAIFEDDIQICKNVRPYLDAILPSLGLFGAIALYTPSHLKKSAFGLQCIHDESYMGARMWGTQGIVFTSESLASFLTYRSTVMFRREGLGVVNKNRDSALGMWAKQSCKKVYYHTPSLVQHVGNESTIQHAFHESEDFAGADFDAMSLLDNKLQVIQSRNHIAMI